MGGRGSHESKIWKHFPSVKSTFFFFFFDRSLILEKTQYKNKLTENKETVEPYTTFYILLGIMELKYVYQVAFR